MSGLVVDLAPKSGAALQALPCFSQLSNDECDRLYARMLVRSIRKAANIVPNLELPGYMGIVWDGVFRVILSPAPARPVAVDTLRRGQMFGIWNFECWGDSLRIECREHGVLLLLQREDFDAFRTQSPPLARAAFEAAAALGVDYASRIFELATLSARDRVVAELLRAVRHGEWRGKACMLTPPPTHQDIAEQVGAAREVVTRALKSLAKDGMIRIGRCRLEVLDVESLLALDERATGRRRDSYFRLRRRGGLQ